MGRPIPEREASKDDYVKKHWPENYDAYKENERKKLLRMGLYSHPALKTKASTE